MEGHWDILIFDADGERVGAIEGHMLADDTIDELNKIAKEQYPDYDFE